MLYDTSNPLDREKFLFNAGRIAAKGLRVELTIKKQRTLSQNAYLHVILGYFALNVGETLEYVKQNYYKRLVNPQLFMVEKSDPYLGRVQYAKSSAALSTEQMTLSIERFRNWASMQAGIYLPSPQDHELIRQAEMEIERHKKYL